MTKANKFIVAIAVTAFMMGAVTLPSVTILETDVATVMATVMFPVSVACLAGTVIAVALCKDKKFSVAGMILAAVVAFLSIGLWIAAIMAYEFADLSVRLALSTGSDHEYTYFADDYFVFGDLFPICVVGIVFTSICFAAAFFAPLVAKVSDARGRLGISPVFTAAVAVFVIINIACSAFFDLNAYLELSADRYTIYYDEAGIFGDFAFPMYMCTNISVLFLFLVASVVSVFVRSDAVRKAVETPIVYICAITMTILIPAGVVYDYPIVLPIPAYWFVAIAYTVLRFVPRVNAALSGAYGGKDKDPAPAMPQQTAAPAQPQLVQPPQPQRARPAQPVRSRYAQPAPPAQPQRRQPPPRYVTPPVQSPQPQYAQPQYAPPQQPQYAQPQYAPPEQPQYAQPQYAPPQRRQTPPRYAPPSGEYANAAPPDIRRQPSQRPSAPAPEVRGEEAAVRNDGTDERNDAR